MEKSDQDKTFFETSLDVNNLKNQSTRTTNINILLNRVKLDQKKEFKKKLIFTFFITSIVGTFLFFAIF